MGERMATGSGRKRSKATSAAPQLRRAPAAFEAFVRRFPGLGRAWDQLGEAGAAAGPLEVRVQRLVKLAIAIGSRQEGAVHSGVRKALHAGASVAELEQVVALAASLLGLPATVAAYCQVREECEKSSRRKR